MGNFLSDVSSDFAMDGIENVVIAPIVIGLVQQVFHGKIEHEHPIEVTSEIATHRVVTV